MTPTATLVLRHMRGRHPLDWHVTGELSVALQASGSTVNRAMHELHALSLVEPGRRSAWRLSAMGRSPGATFTSPL